MEYGKKNSFFSPLYLPTTALICLFSIYYYRKIQKNLLSFENYLNGSNAERNFFLRDNLIQLIKNITFFKRVQVSHSFDQRAFIR